MKLGARGSDTRDARGFGELGPDEVLREPKEARDTRRFGELGPDEVLRPDDVLRFGLPLGPRSAGGRYDMASGASDVRNRPTLAIEAWNFCWFFSTDGPRNLPRVEDSQAVVSSTATS